MRGAASNVAEAASFCPPGLFTDEPLPRDGFIDLPDRPGFGVTLNREGLVRPYPRTAEESARQAQANIDRPVPSVAKMPF